MSIFELSPEHSILQNYTMLYSVYTELSPSCIAIVIVIITLTFLLDSSSEFAEMLLLPIIKFKIK